MRHQDRNRKFGRKRDGRRILLRSLAHALVEKEKITTTEAKAKELRPFIERLVTHAKNDSVASRRLVRSRIGSETSARRLAKDIAPRYKKRNGGYTRITKLAPRKSDGSKMAVIEFVK